MVRTKQNVSHLSETISRVALYARVSTVNSQQDPEMQLAELREYACRRGLTIHEEYVDHGISGSKESRPALNRMMIDARRRKFDAVLVWKIDRLGRSLKHLVVTLADLNDVGVAFISLRDNLTYRKNKNPFQQDQTERLSDVESPSGQLNKTCVSFGEIWISSKSKAVVGNGLSTCS